MIEWKQIEEAPDYWISNRGEVLTKRVPNKEKLMKLFANKRTGYLQVCLFITEKGFGKQQKVTFYPHLLVGKYFVPNPNNLNRVNHMDLDKTNNHYWNLEWTTQRENIHHYYNSNANNKPRNMKAVEVWSLGGDYINTYPSINQAAKETNTSAATVWRQVIGEIKNPKKFIFKYEE